MDYSGDEPEPLFLVGPFGYEWTFNDLDEFAYEYPEWFDDFYELIYAEMEYNDEDYYFDDDYEGQDNYPDLYDKEPDYKYEGEEDFVMCTMMYVDCSERGGYDLSDPCYQTCNDGRSNFEVLEKENSYYESEYSYYSYE